MIFATCGSSEIHFDRMMKALGVLPAPELHVQHGPANPPACALAHPYLPFGTLVEQIEAADVVVSHAGVGTILCAIRAGHTPIIFPRLRRYGEAVDDHQAELAEALATRGTAMIARDAAELAAAVRSAPPRRGAMLSRSGPLHDAVYRAISGAPAELAVSLR